MLVRSQRTVFNPHPSTCICMKAGQMFMCSNVYFCLSKLECIKTCEMNKYLKKKKSENYNTFRLLCFLPCQSACDSAHFALLFYEHCAFFRGA